MIIHGRDIALLSSIATAIQNEKISKLEDSCYTKIEAQYLTKEVDELKRKSN